MTDTVEMRLQRKHITEEQLEWLISIIEIEKKTETRQGHIRYIGSYKNFQVTINHNTVCVNGSLTKFVLGHNIGTINFQQTKDALYKLQHELSIPILKAELARIDVGECFFVDNMPIHYLSSMLSTDRYGREIRKSINHSLCYTYSNNIELAIYNKTFDAIKTPIAILPSGKEVIRIELRIKSNVLRTLINKRIKFGVFFLLSPSFHKRLSAFWRRHYDAIVKKHEIYEYPKMKSGKDYFHYQMASFVNKRGIEDFHSELQIIAKESKWTSRNLSLMRKKLQAYQRNSSATVPNRYIKELELEICNGYIWQLAHKSPHC